ncbi:hypothetical protein BV509_21220 [Rhodovulum sulfidophilum]|nr:hypothetical protein BV509_21220 [Rhodovulum sulfidophilum]
MTVLEKFRLLIAGAKTGSSTPVTTPPATDPKIDPIDTVTPDDQTSGADGSTGDTAAQEGGDQTSGTPSETSEPEETDVGTEPPASGAGTDEPETGAGETDAAPVIEEPAAETDAAQADAIASLSPVLLKFGSSTGKGIKTPRTSRAVTFQRTTPPAAA